MVSSTTSCILTSSHACNWMNPHSCFSAHQFVFLFMVIENVQLVKILIFRFLVLLCRLCLLIKAWGGGEDTTAKWFEQILKTLLKMLNFENVCSLDVLQLVLLWNFPGIRITGNFSTTCSSYFRIITLLSLHVSVDVVPLLH